MAKYINKFDTVAQYNAEKDNLDYPSINYVVETDSLEYYTPAPTPSYETQYLTFRAREDGTFKFSKGGLSYSLDNGETWTTLAKNTNSPTVQSGNTIMWKGTFSTSTGVGTFSSTGAFDAEGNIMSLLFGDNFIGQTSLSGYDYAFYGLFSGCTHLISAENLVLPATTLAPYCYMNMFDSCTSLTTAPELPATTLADSCYNGMFWNCTSLTTAPSLPATTLANKCYEWMFNGCTSLTAAPSLPATTLADGCYGVMFVGCRSLTTAPQLPATTLAYYCYEEMFSGCESLTTAPELLATTLAEGCYFMMFGGCSNLNYVTCLATDISAPDCTSDWLDGVSSNGTFVKAAGMNDWTSGSSGVPENWAVVDYFS